MLSPHLLRQLIAYDTESGELIWKSRWPSLFEDGAFPARRRCNRWNAVYSGKPALTARHRDGYKHGHLMGRLVLAHRVAWAVHWGAWPSGQIDHINGDRSDNRIENLRDVTPRENGLNQQRRSTNTSGCMGVSFHKPSQQWRARISQWGKRIHLGLFATIEEATAARREAEVSYGYHPNHNREIERG